LNSIARVRYTKMVLVWLAFAGVLVAIFFLTHR
jgi:hypothetical protein